MPFGLHGIDLIVLLVVALLVFGPKRLPQMGAAIGQTFHAFKNSVNEISGANNDAVTAPDAQIAAPLATAPVIAEPIVTPAQAPRSLTEAG